MSEMYPYYPYLTEKQQKKLDDLVKGLRRDVRTLSNLHDRFQELLEEPAPRDIHWVNNVGDVSEEVRSTMASLDCFHFQMSLFHEMFLDRADTPKGGV
jgi:hypothetical protein